MNAQHHELVLIADQESHTGKQAFAFAKSLTDAVIWQNPSSMTFSSTYLKTILNKLKMSAKDLLNKADPGYQAIIKGSDLSDEDWLNVLKNNMHLLKAPIALFKDKAVLCNPPSLIYTINSN
ncbi:MAG: arsenate reductase [Flavobacteriales bacterium]|jgi:arsenate reductase